MRLIDADALRASAMQATETNEVSFNNCFPYWQFSKCIKEAPTIDAVPVVRCEKCKWRGEWTDVRGSRHPQCQNPDNGMAGGVEITDDDYCSYGEKMDKEDT